MKLHKREGIVRDSQTDLKQAWFEIRRDNELTVGEELRVLAKFLHDEVGGHAKYMIRFERHGNYEDEGGLE